MPTHRVKFTPDISLGNLTSMLSVLVSVIGVTTYIGKIEAKANTNVDSIKHIVEQRAEDQERIKDQNKETLEALKEVNRKVDQLLIITTQEAK